MADPRPVTRDGARPIVRAFQSANGTLVPPVVLDMHPDVTTM